MILLRLALFSIVDVIKHIRLVISASGVALQNLYVGQFHSEFSKTGTVLFFSTANKNATDKNVREVLQSG